MSAKVENEEKQYLTIFFYISEMKRKHFIYDSQSLFKHDYC